MSEKAISAALSVEEIGEAHLTRNQLGHLAGTAYDRASGVEFDIRQDGRSWNVNDDRGRDFRSLSLARALRKAVRAQ